MDILKIFGCWATCIAIGTGIGMLMGGDWWGVGAFAGLSLPVAWALWETMRVANS